MAATRVLHADAVIVGDGTSIRDGAISIEENGVICDVGAASDVRARSAGARVERLQGVLMPGLVNAHTHLELSSLRGRTKSGAGFVPWLESMQRARASEDEAERDAAIDRAIAELLEHGVVAIGEVTNSLVAWRRVARHLLGTIFHEIFSVDRDRGLALVEAMEAQRDASAPTGDDAHATRWAPAPHAVYSTHPDVVRALVAKAAGGPTTMHLAEHPAERSFLATRGGPFRSFLDARGLSAAAAAFPIDDRGPVARALELGIARKNSAIVHLADARDDELSRLAEVGAIAVLCPRSNLALETKLPPWNAMAAAGLDVALGTDSLASSPSLDPLAEARALLERYPNASPSLLLCAATKHAARAIGWSDALGVLSRGFSPGILHIQGTLDVGVDASAWVLAHVRAPRRLVVRASRRSS